jgi:hypothetical protein
VASLCCTVLRGYIVVTLQQLLAVFALTTSGDKLDTCAGVSTIAAAEQVVHLQRMVVSSACSTQPA